MILIIVFILFILFFFLFFSSLRYLSALSLHFSFRFFYLDFGTPFETAISKQFSISLKSVSKIPRLLVKFVYPNALSSRCMCGRFSSVTRSITPRYFSFA